MANLSRDKVKFRPKLKSFDLSHIEVNFFDVLKAMHAGKVNTVLDTSTGESVIITSKMYQQLLKVA